MSYYSLFLPQTRKQIKGKKIKRRHRRSIFFRFPWSKFNDASNQTLKTSRPTVQHVLRVAKRKKSHEDKGPYCKATDHCTSCEIRFSDAVFSESAVFFYLWFIDGFICLFFFFVHSSVFTRRPFHLATAVSTCFLWLKKKKNQTLAVALICWLTMNVLPVCCVRRVPLFDTAFVAGRKKNVDNEMWAIWESDVFVMKKRK